MWTDFNIKLLLFITSSIKFSCVFSRHTSSYPIRGCNASMPLYLLEGHNVQADYFAGYEGKPSLKIQACINNSHTATQELDLYHMLSNITFLELHFVTWPSLSKFPDLTKLKEIHLYDITPIDVWGSCSSVNLIHIYDSINTTLMSSDWLVNCTKLQEVNILDMTIAEIRAIVDTTMGLQNLYLFRIKDEPTSHIVSEPLFSINRGRHQSLKNVNVHDIVRGNSSLKDGFQTPWAEVSAALVFQMSLLPNLEELFITEENFDFCPSGNFPSVTFTSLEYLNLYRTSTKRFCYKKLRIMPRLKRLFFSYSSQIDVQFSELYSTPAPNIAARFLFSSDETLTITSFDFARDDYLALSNFEDKGSQRGNITLTNMRFRIDCNCENTLWFARALREQLVTATDVSCRDGRRPAEITCENMDCDRVPCDSICLCCRAEPNNIVADCRNTGLTEIPAKLLRQPNLAGLLAPNNNILKLPDHLPNTLLLLDLSGNDIWHHGSTDIVLFSQPNRRLRLAKNKILCSCETKNLIVILQEKRDQIEDFQKLRCEISNQLIGEVNITKLCEAFDREEALLKQQQIKLLSVIMTLIVVSCTLVLGLIVYYQLRALQIFLFSHGCCLACVREDELDSDRQYDIFLSFCHADTEIVLNELLPILDREYSVCVHLRDWHPGEMIPAHIAMSVAQSRRTIVVLSRHFVRSLWGRLEFQTARMNGLVEGRVRVVMIVLDDVLEQDEVEGDLRAYVRLNTYLKWGDPWFWEKLRFALPHHPSPHLFVPCTSPERVNTALVQYIQMRQLQEQELSSNTTS